MWSIFCQMKRQQTRLLLHGLQRSHRPSHQAWHPKCEWICLRSQTRSDCHHMKMWQTILIVYGLWRGQKPSHQSCHPKHKWNWPGSQTQSICHQMKMWLTILHLCGLAVHLCLLPKNNHAQTSHAVCSRNVADIVLQPSYLLVKRAELRCRCAGHFLELDDEIDDGSNAILNQVWKICIKHLLNNVDVVDPSICKNHSPKSNLPPPATLCSLRSHFRSGSWLLANTGKGHKRSPNL